MRLPYIFLSLSLVACTTSDFSSLGQAISYQCLEGQSFSVDYHEGKSMVNYLNETQVMYLEESGSGVKYKSYDGNSLLFTKGDEAMLTWGNDTLTGCRVED